MSFGVSGSCNLLNNENFPYGKFGKRERVRHQAHVSDGTYCEKAAYQVGTLSVAQRISAGMMSLLGGAAPRPRDF